MKLIRTRPVIWPWILALLLFSLMTWGVLEIAGPESPPGGETGAPTASAEVRARNP